MDRGPRVPLPSPARGPGQGFPYGLHRPARSDPPGGLGRRDPAHPQELDAVPAGSLTRPDRLFIFHLARPSLSRDRRGSGGRSVLIDRRNFARHRPWLIFLLAVTALSCAWYLFSSLGSSQWP